ncbi:hypothetical protein EVAR_100185_1 [Eumeta japonica]|uniref:Uncharacterized protein n=1 Tax=Eumeta variegata TaxID=151549 RepID=A0A4C2ADN7_EUMVA|nr:hypothetical protein EVAR_100185_1 [Eumeta japonica]
MTGLDLFDRTGIATFASSGNDEPCPIPTGFSADFTIPTIIWFPLTPHSESKITSWIVVRSLVYSHRVQFQRANALFSTICPQTEIRCVPSLDPIRGRRVY